MNHANDNDTIPRQQAVNDLFDARGEALLHGLYAQTLLALRHQVDRECTARGRDFAAIDRIHFLEQEEDQRGYLMSVFRDASIADAFETVAEFHNVTVHFWNALAVEYIEGRSDSAERAIDQSRGELVEALWELGGVGNHEAEELIRRCEGRIRTAMQGLAPDYKASRSL